MSAGGEDTPTDVNAISVASENPPTAAEADPSEYIIKANDGKLFTVSASFLDASKVLEQAKSLVIDPSEPIPIHDVESGTLELIIEFHSLYEGKPAYVPIDVNMDDNFNPIDDIGVDFFNTLNEQTLIRLIHGAAYLDYTHLSDFAAWYLIKIIKPMDTKRMQKFFRVKDPFTEEEEKVLDTDEWEQEHQESQLTERDRRHRERQKRKAEMDAGPSSSKIPRNE